MARKAMTVVLLWTLGLGGCVGQPDAVQLAALLPEDVLLVGEGRNQAASEEIFRTVLESEDEDNWPGDLVGLSAEQIKDELKKTKVIAALHVVAGRAEPVSVQIFDFSRSETIRNAFATTVEKEKWPISDTVEGVSVYRMPDKDAQDTVKVPQWCCLTDDYLVMADRREDLPDAIKRIRGKHDANLADSETYRKAMAGVPDGAACYFYVNVREYNKLLKGKTPFDHGDVAFMNVFVDFNVMDTATLAFTKKGDAILADVGVVFSKQSKAYAALQTDPGEHTVLQWMPADFRLVVGGTVSADPKRLERIEAFMDQAFFTGSGKDAPENPFRKEIAPFEADTGLKVTDELANLQEAAVGISRAKDAGFFPSILIILKFKDAERLAAMTAALERAHLKGRPNAKIEEVDLGDVKARKLADSGYVIRGNYLLFEFPFKDGTCLSAALKARKEKQSILERPDVTSVMKDLHAPNSRVFLLTMTIRRIRRAKA